MNNVIKANAFSKIYKQALELVVYNPDFECSPRGQKIKECLNVTLVLTDPLNNLFFNSIREYPKKYLANELYLYLTGENNGQKFGEHAKLWLQLLNDDGTVNSAYGHLIFKKQECKWEGLSCSQWYWAVKSLIADKDSRQAILHYNTPVHQYEGVKDFVCTLHNQFFIRNNVLYMNYQMRSNDLWYGTTADVPWATVLMQLMYIELLPFYPELKIGHLSFSASSLHLYEKHFQKAETALRAGFFEARLPKLTEIPIYMSLFSKKDNFVKWIESNK